jgi:hypothetical protein
VQSSTLNVTPSIKGEEIKITGGNISLGFPFPAGAGMDDITILSNDSGDSLGS